MYRYNVTPINCGLPQPCMVPDPTIVFIRNPKVEDIPATDARTVALDVEPNVAELPDPEAKRQRKVKKAVNYLFL
jgi:hypothetical protein